MTATHPAGTKNPQTRARRVSPDAFADALVAVPHDTPPSLRQNTISEVKLRHHQRPVMAAVGARDPHQHSRAPQPILNGP